MVKARLKLPGIKQDSPVEVYYANILCKLLEECPKGYLDIRLFLIDWTSLSSRKAKDCVAKIEAHWAEMKDGIVQIEWGSRSALIILDTLMWNLSLYVDLPNYNGKRFKWLYYVFVQEKLGTGRLNEDVPDYYRIMGGIEEVKRYGRRYYEQTTETDV